jgi:UDP-N-acetyl-D-mannosaminuronic acid transferase (WecB/TagA/CpsF family)
MFHGVVFHTPKSSQRGLAPEVQVASALAKIDGQDVTTSGLSEVVSAVLPRFVYPKSFIVYTPNLDYLVKLRRKLALRQAYAGAELVAAEAFPIVMLARLDPRVGRAALFRAIGGRAPGTVRGTLVGRNQ